MCDLERIRFDFGCGWLMVGVWSMWIVLIGAELL